MLLYLYAIWIFLLFTVIQILPIVLQIHRNVLKKYPLPEDVMPSFPEKCQSLPVTPLKGMFNKYGVKVRLDFRLETDELVINTKDRTIRIPMRTIKNVTNGEINGHEGYHIVGFQLGSTEASIYWVYYVPRQYVETIKDIVMGKWP